MKIVGKLFHYLCIYRPVKLKTTPKYHPEMAGEGIEYIWAQLKISFRRIPLQERKSKQKFHKNVKACFTKAVIPTKLVHKLSRKSRRFTILYFLYEHGMIPGKNDAVEVESENRGQLLLCRTENSKV